MKQIGKDKLCYYCLGCQLLEGQFEGARNCKTFAPDRENWREELYKELKKNDNKNSNSM